MLKRNRLPILGIAAALVSAAAIWGAARLLYDPVDDCLDAGGSWHYDVEECSFTENYRSASTSLDEFVRRNEVSPAERERLAEFRKAVNLQRLNESGLGKAEIQDRLARCGAIREAGLKECDNALRSASDDPETIARHPYCRSLTETEHDECLLAD